MPADESFCSAEAHCAALCSATSPLPTWRSVASGAPAVVNACTVARAMAGDTRGLLETAETTAGNRGWL